MLYGWIDDAQEKPPLFLGVDRDGAAIYLHSANMETKANNKIGTKLRSSTESVKGKTKAEKSRVHS
jgi:hypothetical protein